MLPLTADVPGEAWFFLLPVAAPSDQNAFWGRVAAEGGLLGTRSTCRFLTRACAHIISITCRLGGLFSARSVGVPFIKAQSRPLCIDLLAPRQQHYAPAMLAAGEARRCPSGCTPCHISFPSRVCKPPSQTSVCLT